MNLSGDAWIADLNHSVYFWERGSKSTHENQEKVHSLRKKCKMKMFFRGLPTIWPRHIIIIGIALFSAVGGKAANLDISRFQPISELKTYEKQAGGIVHLSDDFTGARNDGLMIELNGQELTPFRGKFIIVSGFIRQLRASVANCIGISVTVRPQSGRWLEHSATIPATGPEEWRKLTASIFVPDNAAAIFIYLACAKGHGYTGEAWFRDLSITASDAGTAHRAQERYTGYLSIAGKAIPWEWTETPGVHVTVGKNGISADGSGTVAIRPANSASIDLNEINESSALELEYSCQMPFEIDFVSYGKQNRSVTVESSEGKKRTLKIPLSAFAGLNDLVNFNGIDISIKAASIVIERMALTGIKEPSVNILPDPSFEKSSEAKPTYHMLDEYQTELSAKGVSVTDKTAYDGTKSLEIAPEGFFSWSSYDRAGNGAVFSFYAKSAEGTTLDVMLQPLTISMHGGSAPILRKSIKLKSGNWSRQYISVQPPAKNPPPQDFNLFRVRINNTGNDPVFIDAVQLEQGTTTPGRFMAVRDSSVKIGGMKVIDSVRYPDMTIKSANRPGQVKLSALNPNPEPVHQAVIGGGVCFPAGVLFHTEAMKLRDSSGKEVKAQFNALARRPVDGSIIALKVTFNADLKPGANHDFILMWDQQKSPDNRMPIAEKKGTEIVVNTGKLKFTVTPSKESVLREIPLRCVFEDISGKRFTSVPETVTIEENGPLSCTILIRGKALFTYELRIGAFADKDYLRIDYAFENNISGAAAPLNQTIRAAYLELPGGTVWTAGELHGRSPAALSQRHRRTGSAEWNVYEAANGKATVHEGMRLDGAASNENVKVYVENIWRQAPRGFGFTNEALKVFLWPSAGVDYLDATAGLSASMRLWIGLGKDGLPVYQTPLLQADAEWAGTREVFGIMNPAETLDRCFPRSSRLIDTAFDGILREAPLKNMYGYGDFGDFGTRAWTLNHETATLRSLWTRYLRTGNFSDYDLAVNHSIHQRDIDMCHGGRFMKGVFPHYRWTNSNFNFHTGHFWLTGLVYHYYLTGDYRSLDAIIGAASVLVQKSAIKYHGGRERTRMLYHLAEIYELTGNREIKEAFERQYNHPHDSASFGYYGALAHEALLKLYQVTGDKKYLDELNSEVGKCLSKNAVPEPMPQEADKAPTLTGAAEEGRECLRLYMEAVMSRVEDSPKYMNYLSQGKDSYVWSLLSPNGRDACLEWCSFYLDAMKDFKISESPILPENLSFINRLVGKMSMAGNNIPFRVIVKPDSDSIAKLDLYRIRSFRYWFFKRTDDRLAVKAFDSSGKLLKETELCGNVPAEYRKFAVESPDGKEVHFDVSFENDCWGGISAPTPFRVGSERWFSTRTSISVPVSFFLKAPESGILNIEWRWLCNNHSSSGEILGFRLETPDGREVASESFTIPFEYPAEQNRCGYNMQIKIPEKYRNRTLKAYIPDPKWIEWKISGLDSPWLWDEPR